MKFEFWASVGGVPLAAVTPTFSALYQVEDGSDILILAPAITELGGGWYQFEWTGSTAVGTIDLGAALSNVDRYLPVRFSVDDDVLAAIVDGAVSVRGALASMLARSAGRRRGGGTGTIKFLRQDQATVAIQLNSVDRFGNSENVEIDLP